MHNTILYACHIIYMRVYTFDSFLLNGLGADLVRLAVLYHFMQGDLCMNANDRWKLVPTSAVQNWFYYFESLHPRKQEPQFPITEQDVTHCMSRKDITFHQASDAFRKIYRVKPAIMKYVATAAKIIPAEPYCAVHIRRGDKVQGPWKEGHAIPVQDYLNAVPRDVTTVYVMTDSQAVIDELNTLVTRFRIVYDVKEKRRDGFVYKHHASSYDDSEVVDEVLTFFTPLNI